MLASLLIAKQWLQLILAAHVKLHFGKMEMVLHAQHVLIIVQIVQVKLIILHALHVKMDITLMMIKHVQYVLTIVKLVQL